MENTEQLKELCGLLLRVIDLLTQIVNAEELTQNNDNADGELNDESNKHEGKGSVGVIVVSDGKILTGKRLGDFGSGEVCGPGGHIESGETPEQAAIRETQEEFGITPKDLIPIGRGPVETDTKLSPYIFLCTEYEGEIKCKDGEICEPRFISHEEINNTVDTLFKPFADSVLLLFGTLLVDEINSDGGQGSGNHGHKGVKGQLGGSAMKTGNGIDTIRDVAAEIPKPKIEQPEDSVEKIVKPFLEKIGFGGKPSVLSDNDFDSAESYYPVQYRGIDFEDGYDKFVGDDFFVGSGANGSGTNTTPNLKTAQKFAGDNGKVIEIKLDKSAKVITDTELIKKMGEFGDAEPNNGIDEMTFYKLANDPGCIAASLGYDAIYDSETKWLNIINRGKMVVREQKTK